MRILKLLFLILMPALISAQKQEMFKSTYSQKQLSATEIFQEIKKLNVLGNVLYLAAHPDDENTRFISFCANEKLFNTAYLSLTRGDGGQNLIGTEIREELGIIRTQELLAARKIDGGKQFFTRANDFGYSKTPEETLEIWDREKVLSDVVWVIRKFRPDVIVCRFPSDGGGGHGHHTSSAILAKEAFQIAGDKTKFPDQLKYVDVWKPTRVVTNTGRWWNDSISADDEGVVVENIGQYNANLGISYNELAALSRTMHKSQGFGSTGNRGGHIEYFEHVIGNEAEKSLFDGFNSSWDRVKGAGQIKESISKVISDFDINDPSSSIASLLQLRNQIESIDQNVWTKQKIKAINEIIIQCAGIYIAATSDEYSKANGDSLNVSVEIINRSNAKCRIKEIKSNQVKWSSSLNIDAANNKKIIKDYQFLVDDIKISQPYWLREKPSLGGYTVNDQLLIGNPENEPTIVFTVEMEIEGELIIKEIPLVYKSNDPVKGEQSRSFIVTPTLTANISEPIYLFSSQDAQEIEIKLKSHSANQSGEISIVTPEGWEVTHKKQFNLKLKGDEEIIKVSLKATENAKDGNLKVLFNNDQLSAINIISYDHIPTQVWFPLSQTKLVYVNLKKKGELVGYIKGAGDLVPEALRNIGYKVDMLDEEDLSLENLMKYDAIITGIRFFNVNARSPFMAPKLMDYVENGGNLIVQYNTRHRMKTQEFGPYPIKLSRDRVTEENAEVVFLAPNHKALNSPNKITANDFEGWVQERGLYFPSEWDEKYQPILSWHDKNETPKEGSLLVASYGKGNYVYTGISFFRELPAGVSGAYRLLVNLISLEDE